MHFQNAQTRDSVSVGDFLELPSKTPRCWIPLFSNNQIDYATSYVVHVFPKDNKLSIFTCGKAVKARHRQVFSGLPQEREGM